jgi:methionyl-tRNA formyltransferase
MKKVDEILEQERERIEKYMTESSFDKYIAVVQDELLVKHMSELLDKPSGLNYILKNNIVKDMSLLYKLY